MDETRPSREARQPTKRTPESRLAADPPAAPTQPSATPAARQVSGSVFSGGASSTDSTFVDHGRFPPGHMLNQRFRIIELLGRGGMGEVYRADDLALGQTVALKFLTGAAATDAARIEELRHEVRVARQVAHPNVCRVYDIGEAEGHPFLTMEYIDGENLASLLLRIGRLPADKGVELARQLCAGLAAAHDAGVLHRDLKPSNVMVDGRGRVRITDFGLAAVADRLGPHAARAGTPAYMAPEQLAGREVSARSDLFALGLVLFEIFTGKRLFHADSLDQLARLHESSSSADPSRVVPELHPSVVEVIRRCLERDPSRRPGSAVLVAAALPGGDPLAAALAAGETPSPELVAASRETGTLAPWIGLTCLCTILIGLIASAVMNDRFDLTRLVAFEKPPAVLQERAREIARSFGHAEKARDAFGQFRVDSDVVRHVHARFPRPSLWGEYRRGDYPAIQYWFRQSPEALVPLKSVSNVTTTDPPRTVRGEWIAWLDSRGRLWKFLALPAERTAGGFSPREPDWKDAFQAAELDLGQFDAAQPEWAALVFSDTRMAWVGRRANDETPLRVEAGAFNGRINYFQVVGPWTQHEADTVDAEAATWMNALMTVLVLATLVAALLLAWRNLRLGRGDRRGAMRLAAFVMITGLAGWVVIAHHAGSARQIIEQVVSALGPLVFASAAIWLTYVAVEPLLRRRAPRRLIGWTRLLAGQWRDALVGRDVLIGLTAGVGLLLIERTLPLMLSQWMDTVAPWPRGQNAVLASAGFSAALSALLAAPTNALFNASIFFGFATFLTIIARREWLAALVAVSLFAVIFSAQRESSLVSRTLITLSAALWVLVPLRGGMLAGTAMFFAYFLLSSAPLTLEPGSWHAGPGQLLVFSTLLLAGGAFYFSLAGRRLFRAELLE